MRYYAAPYPSPLGVITLGSDGENLVGLWLEGQRYREADAGPVNDGLPVFEAARDWLDRYFAGERPSAWELPLAASGSPFRRQVWRLLCEIPYGQVTTYGELAGKIAAAQNRDKMSAQAVGGAVGHNPISIIIPCHRVVGSNGSLTGYGGGIGRKIQLLRHEGVDMSRMFVPARGTAL